MFVQLQPYTSENHTINLFHIIQKGCNRDTQLTDLTIQTVSR
jgi:hypothetical protein